MESKRLLMLAALLMAGCGGTPEPVSEETAATEPPLAVEDIAPRAAQPAATPSGQSTLPAAGAQNGGAAAPISERFQLGTHFSRLSPTQPTSSGPTQVEVAEVFWYGCPHCYTFDPYLQNWQSSKADYVNFVRIPAVWNALARLHARAFYTADALGKGAEMHAAFFREIHVNGNALDSEAKLSGFFGRFGVDEAAFKSAFDSFAVHTKLQRADELSRRYQISSVPSIVVNGKYTTDGSMAGGYDQMIELINELAASERTAD
ncbi:MAG TPA: thiol:disulfide interchange protein DsbA/DsbL [Gammaproteobacteria bacterium]|nr:thiol:disulfide interchange protein DsbA/DsbL [Gammaproteobacteria bacterium]